MYKRTWTKKFGKSEIFTKEDSFCQKVEIDMVKLADGQTKTYSETDKEYGKVDGYKYAVKKMGADNNVIKLKKNLLS